MRADGEPVVRSDLSKYRIVRSSPVQRTRRRVPTERREAFVAPPVTPTATFSADELQGACERLRAGDGLHHLLGRIGGEEARDCRLPLPARFTAPGFLRRHRATLVVVALYAVLVIAPGFLFSVFGTHVTDREFVRLTDGRELPGALFLYLVLAPVLWTFYLWQPRLIVEVFAGLAEGGVIGPARRVDATPDGFLQRMGASLSRPVDGVAAVRVSKGGLLAALAAATAVATLLVWPPTAPSPVDEMLPSSDLFWWRVVPVYFWAVWLPMVFVNVYMLVWIVIRQTIMIANIQRLLRLFAVEPIPFHPDRCSGFAPIGSYATDIARVALIIGGWALVLLLSGPVTGHGLYVAPATLSLVLLQVILTPYLLLGPVWYAHRVMREARDRALQRVADQIRVRLVGVGADSLARGQAPTYRELESRYRLAEEGYHTWPFGHTAFSGVSITAGLTLVGNIALIIYRADRL